MLQRGFLILGFLIVIASGLFTQDLEELDPYLHVASSIGNELPSTMFPESFLKPITPREAASFAFGHLVRRGVRDPLICEARWIAAPLGGYLVDAIGTLAVNDTTYSLFRIGVRDGTEETEDLFKAGEEFVYIARGTDSSDMIVWYPPPGPDDVPAESEAYELMLPYEFLIGREEFEALPERYPIDQIE